MIQTISKLLILIGRNVMLWFAFNNKLLWYHSLWWNIKFMFSCNHFAEHNKFEWALYQAIFTYINANDIVIETISNFNKTICHRCRIPPFPMLRQVRHNLIFLAIFQNHAFDNIETQIIASWLLLNLFFIITVIIIQWNFDFNLIFHIIFWSHNGLMLRSFKSFLRHAM